MYTIRAAPPQYGHAIGAALDVSDFFRSLDREIVNGLLARRNIPNDFAVRIRPLPPVVRTRNKKSLGAPLPQSARRNP